MADLIDRAALKIDTWERLSDAVRDLAEAPRVDAVEVVRCKDCIYYKTGEYFKDMKFCFRLKHPKKNKQVGYNYPEDGFCSYGERRTDADN